MPVPYAVTRHKLTCIYCTVTESQVKVPFKIKDRLAYQVVVAALLWLIVSVCCWPEVPAQHPVGYDKATPTIASLSIRPLTAMSALK